MGNQKFKLRRSSVPGKIPDTGSLDFGEIALNTHDGVAYMKKSGSGGEQIIPIGTGISGSITGSLYGTSSWAINSISASYLSGSQGIVDTFSSSQNITVNNLVIGRPALIPPFNRDGNIVIGSGSFLNAVSASGTTSGSENIGIGDFVFTQNIIGHNNVAIGHRALGFTTGSNSTAVGAYALSSSYGARNTAFGQAAGVNLLQGSFNTIIGDASMFYAQTAVSNTTVGYGSIANLVSGSHNTAIGTIALRELLTGSFNTVIGSNSGRGLISGSYNTVIGILATLEPYVSNNIILSDGAGNIRARYSSSTWTLSDSTLGSFTGSLQGTASYALNSISGAYSLSASFSQDSATSSLALNAQTSSNLLGGTATYIPFWDTDTTLSNSAILQISNSFSTTSIAINEPNITSDNPEALYVFQTHPTSINVITGKGNLNSYLQNNIQNTNQGISASSDVVATANNGNESTNYIDMGINSENYAQGFVGGANDAYLYSIANNLHIGNANNNGTHVGFFVGGSDVETNNKLQLNPNNQHIMSGSLDLSGSLKVNNGITGSLLGTSSWANNSISSSYALTASYAGNVPETASYSLQALSSSYALTSSYSISSSQANNAYTASYALTASYAGNVPETASYALQALSSSYSVNSTNSSTASSADDFTVRGTLTAQRIVVQTITSSTDFVTGSSRFGSSLINTHQFTGSVSVTGSLNVIGSISGSLTGTASWANNAISASNALTASYVLNAVSASQAQSAISSSYPLKGTDSAIYSFNTSNTNTTNVIAIGESAGDGSTDANDSNFLGSYAGYSATYANNSNFIGTRAGEQATNANDSNFFGRDAGSDATYANSSNFLGANAGSDAAYANNSNFLGDFAGIQATNANYSNFLGLSAGEQATNANYSNFLGKGAGQWAAYASYSTLIGYRVGHNIAGGASGIKSNNIIIGTNITLDDGRQNSINLGGLIFGTGSYSDTGTNPFSGSANGRIGINQPLPLFSLDVSGSGRYTNGLQVTGSLISSNITGSLLGTASWASNALNSITSSYILIAVSASQAQNAVSSSYPFRVTGSTIASFNAASNISSNNNIAIGFQAGLNVSGGLNYTNVFIGSSAGYEARTQESILIGGSAGFAASSSNSSVMIGHQTGELADNSPSSTFVGFYAGNRAPRAISATFIGVFAGNSAIGSSNSAFVGSSAGSNASFASHSVFIGSSAGTFASSASYSTLIGYRAGYTAVGLGIRTNNIIIGTNITLPQLSQNAINIGGLVFGTGSYSTVSGNPFSGSANGRIGINQPTPIFSLDVSGSGRYSNGLQVTGSLIVKDFLQVQGLLSGSLIPSGSELYDLGSDSNRFGSLYLAGSTIHLGGVQLKEDSGSLIIIPDSGSGITMPSFSGSFTGSFYGTSSNAVSSSYSLTSSYSLNSDLLDGKDSTTFATTGSNVFVGNQRITGSLVVTGSETLRGYLQFEPVISNIDQSVSASYIYVSGSTNDLYFTQNTNGYNNTVRLRWLEGNMYTGLLNGGLISIVTGSTTFNLSSGSGIIVSLNASIADNPYPTVQYVNWGNFTNVPLTYLTSSIQTYVGINSTGNITQQTTPFINGEYNTKILIGTVLHQNKATINASITYPNVAYGYKQRTYDFIKAFGPLKLSGYNLLPSSSLGLTVGSGTAWADGRNYQVNPNEPSYITDPGTSISKIFRYYQSGSEFVQDTNGGLGYTVIDPVNYNPGGSGSLTPVPGTGTNRQWSTQRVFWYPNSATKGIVVYYGSQTYANEVDAAANISYEQFLEVENTKQNAIYLGALLLRNDAVFTDSTTYKILPGGIFRNVGGSGGGGNITSLLLSQLGDVTISAPADGQALVYNTATLKWENKSFISASISGNAATATSSSYALSASQAQNAVTASYVLNAVSSSFALSSSNSISASYALTSTSSSQAANAISASISNTSSLALRNVLTASAAGSTITFTKGDNTTFNVTLTTATAETASYVSSSNVDGPFGKNSILSSSYALNATNANTASYVLNAISSSFSTSASQANNAVTASYILNAVSASFATSASQAQNAVTASYILNATSSSYALSSSQAQNAVTASYVLNAVSSSYSLSSSYSINSTNASFATQASTASYVLNAISSSYALSASQAQNSVTASYVLNAISSSYALSASQAQSTVSSSFATRAITASYADSLTVAGTLTAQTLVVQTVTSSIDFVTGSSRFGTLLTNTHQFTGSVGMTGSLSVVGAGITGSLFGTSSWASNAISASNAITASYVLNAVSASFATTASYVLNAVSASFATSASQSQNSVTASYILNAISSSFATSASQAQNAVTASYILNAVSASFATTASYSLNAVSASFATTAATASYSNNLTVASTLIIDATLTDYATVASSVVGSNNLFTQATGSYTSAFFKYTVTSGSSTRAGEVVAAWNGSSTQFYDNSTVDIGTTTAVSSSVSIVTGNVQFNIQTNTSGWRIKSLATFI